MCRLKTFKSDLESFALFDYLLLFNTGITKTENYHQTITLNL